jgi:hypothetical protein
VLDSQLAHVRVSRAVDLRAVGMSESHALGLGKADGIGDAFLLGFGECLPPVSELVRVLDLGQSDAPRLIMNITSS